VTNKLGRHEKAPAAPTVEAHEAERKSSRKNVMIDNSTSHSKVIPFDFHGHAVRTFTISDEPWFVASDVCRVLDLANTTQAMQSLDEDERSMFNIGRQGLANIVNESGLYTLILRSRDAVKKGSKPHAFRKWVTSEVLPAIRKHKRFQDDGKMSTLMNALIGMSELNVIKGLIRDKSKAVPAAMQQSFTLTMHRRLRTRFNVSRSELIPASEFDAACNFIGSYALEGEYLQKPSAENRRLNIQQPLDALTCRRPEMLIDRGDGHAWLDVKISDLHDNFRSPCEAVLCELTRLGYDVSGAWWEVRTMRNKLRQLGSFATGMSRVVDEPQRYALKDGAMA
jgi:prophage antirepressor-like protein